MTGGDNHRPRAERVQRARSLLFVPGDRPNRFDKAAAAAPDLVVIDLEDAVAPADKAEARASTAAWLSGGGQACVRVNAVGSPEHGADVDALVGIDGLQAVMLPKADDAAVGAALAQRLSVPVIALIESAAGMARAADIAAADGVARLAFGHLDYAADLGADPTHMAMLHARSTLVLASRTVGLPGPIDGVTAALEDTTALAEDIEHARGLGYTGKLLIHPRQVDQTHHALRPDEQTIAWAQRVVAAATGSRGAIRVDGEMVDAPVLARAKDVLDRADLDERDGPPR